MKENNVLVDVRDLAVNFHIEQGIVRAVDGVSFKIEKGKSLGVVGESGDAAGWGCGWPGSGTHGQKRG